MYYIYKSNNQCRKNLPESISLCTGIPSASSILCLSISLNTGSATHNVVAVRNVFILGTAKQSLIYEEQ